MMIEENSTIQKTWPVEFLTMKALKWHCEFEVLCFCHNIMKWKMWEKENLFKNLILTRKTRIGFIVDHDDINSFKRNTHSIWIEWRCFLITTGFSLNGKNNYSWISISNWFLLYNCTTDSKFKNFKIQKNFRNIQILIEIGPYGP